MKNIKLISILLAVLVLSAVLFVSCTTGGAETTAPDTTVSPEPVETPEDTTEAPVDTAEVSVDTTDPENTVLVEHVWSEWTTAKAPTCTESGISERSCTICSEKETKSIEATGHSFGDWVTVKNADCTNEGSSERVCSCGEKETKSIPATGHSFGELNTVKIASCTEEGLAERVCSCGAKETVTIEKIAHRAGEWVVDKEATANAEGSKHQPCAVCGEVLKTETIPVTPHVPGEWIVDKEATCTDEGSRHRVCTKCGETCDTEKIPAKGHKEVIDSAKEATCTEKGLTEGKHCSVCKAVTVAQKEVPANGHTEVTDAAKEATCTEKGITEGKHCSVCKAVTVAQKEIPAKGHTEGEWITDKAATTTAAGSKHQICSVCGATIKTETIPVIEPMKIEYSVTVLDGMGAPASGVKVTFMSANTTAGSAVTDASGKAVCKLTEGDYDVEIDAGEEYYGSSALKLTASSPSAEIVLVGYAKDPMMVYPDEVNGVYTVKVGSVRVSVKNGELRYFFFRPTEGAIYKIYTDSNNVDVGYYGSDFYVLSDNAGKYDEEGKLIIEFLKSSVGQSVVIGLKSKSASVDECTLTIIRYSDIELSDGEKPYEQYQAKIPTKKTPTPKGSLVPVNIEVDIATFANRDEIKVVYNEADGYYHLHTADGPVLYVIITQKLTYLQDTSLAGIAGSTSVGKIFYDENGNFLKKEGYNEALAGLKDYSIGAGEIVKNGYAQVADDRYGVVPLDADLIYILKNIGDGGWYERGTPGLTDWIFGDSIVMPYNCWLFPVCYFE